jgi:ATP/maltotriose-dependent transcriptional regulator MalT
MMDSLALDKNTTVGKAGLVAQLACIRRNLTGRTQRGIRVALDRAWSRLRALDARDVLASVCALESCLSDLDNDTASRLRAEISALRAAAFALCDDCVAALPLALACRESATAPFLASMATTLCRMAYWKLGDLERFHGLRLEQSSRPEKRHASLIALDRAVEAAVELQQLRFGLAARLAQDALALVPRQARHTFPASHLPTAVLAEVLYEQGALSEAELLVRDRLPLVVARSSPETAIRVYPLLARIAYHHRQGELALFLLGEGTALGEARGWTRLAAACLQQRIELLVRGGQIDEAQATFERMKPFLAVTSRSHYPGAAVYRHACLAKSRLELACKPSLEVVATLRHLHQVAAACGDLYLAVQLAIRLAEALGALGDEEAARQTLARSLELGAGVGLYQSFVDGGAVIGCLLAVAAVRERRFLQPYVESLLNSWRSANQPVGTRKSLKLSGPLSPRERGILGLVRRGYSNKRIALQLGIAPETVKSHAKHIFLKLGAQTRVEAVSRAASLGLI